MIRTFLIDAFIPTYFWLDVAYAAIYAINRLPTTVLQNQSPFEVLFRRVPDYFFIKPFGYVCFLNFMASSSNKLQPRSVHCVFLSYAANYKGYWCLDPISDQVYISCHVLFHETHCPFPHLVKKAPYMSHPFVFCPKDIMLLTPNTRVSESGPPSLPMSSVQLLLAPMCSGPVSTLSHIGLAPSSSLTASSWLLLAYVCGLVLPRPSVHLPCCPWPRLGHCHQARSFVGSPPLSCHPTRFISY